MLMKINTNIVTLYSDIFYNESLILLKLNIAGLHAEGSIVSNLFVLLFWDIMFMDVPNVFHGPFQSCPLDIATQDFYLNRQQLTDERLNWIKNASIDVSISRLSSVPSFS